MLELYELFLFIFGGFFSGLLVGIGIRMEITAWEQKALKRGG